MPSRSKDGRRQHFITDGRTRVGGIVRTSGSLFAAETDDETAAWTTATTVNTQLDLDVSGMAGAVIYVKETVPAGGQITMSASVDGTNFELLVPIDLILRTVGTSAVHTAGDGDKMYAFNVSAFSMLRCELTSVLTAGTFDVTMRGTSAWGHGILHVVGGLGSVTITSGSVAVTSVPAPLSTTGGGTEATALRVTVANDSTGLLSVDDNGGSLTIDNAALSVTGGGVEASALRVTLANDSTGLLSVDDNGASLTIDNAALSVTGGGVEANALRVTIASDSTGVLSVDDNGGSLTVDGTVAATQSGTWTVQPGNTANTTAWLVTGTGGTFPVTDSGGSLTVDNPILSVVGGGTEATAQRVTIANDSTGVLSVDDNGGSLTVDGTVAISGTVTVASHAVTNAGTFAVQADTELPAAVALSDTLANPTTPLVGSALLGWDGTQWRRFAINGTGVDAGLQVYIRDDLSQPVWVFEEDIAHGSGDRGAHVLGVRRDADTTPVSASGDYHSFLFDALGNLKVRSVTGGAATGTVTSVSDSAASVTVLAANAARRGATIYNDSSARMYLKLGATASTTSFTVLLDGNGSGIGGYYEVPSGFTGAIDAIWASNTAGSARVTEITA